MNKKKIIKISIIILAVSFVILSLSFISFVDPLIGGDPAFEVLKSGDIFYLRYIPGNKRLERHGRTFVAYVGDYVNLTDADNKALSELDAAGDTRTETLTAILGNYPYEVSGRFAGDNLFIADDTGIYIRASKVHRYIARERYSEYRKYYYNRAACWLEWRPFGLNLGS